MGDVTPAATSSRLLPGPLDGLVARIAPAWSSHDLRAADAGGTGRRVLHPLLWLLVAAALAQSTLHVVDVAFFDLRLDRINADKDGSVAGWLGTVTTWSAACGALGLALLAPDARRPLLLLAGLCAFLSLDDMVVLHEIVANLALRFEAYGHDGYTLWPMVYFPLLCTVGWLVMRTARTVETGTGRFPAAGLSCLATAVVLEASAPIWYALGSDHGQPLYESEVTIEEALETLGWGLIAFGLVAAVVDLLVARGAAQAARSRLGTDFEPVVGASVAREWPRDGERRAQQDRRRRPSADARHLDDHSPASS